MNLIVRILKSLRARSFKTNCSTWYLSRTQTAEKTTIKYKPSLQYEFRILEGDDKELLHQWLFDNRIRYPWIYFHDEILSSNQNEHWYPCLFDGERLIAWVKLAQTNVFIHDFESTIPLSEGLAFIYDTFVDPDYRKQGLGHLVIERMKSHLASVDYHTVACHIEDWNTSSVSIFKSSGFKPIGKIRYLRLTFFRCLLIDGKLRRLSSLTQWLRHKTEGAGKI
jgi:RimJ/RimL family protein N-acetyltransferase